MQPLFKYLFTTFVIMCVCLVSNGQVKVNLPKNLILDTSSPTILVNNGKLLSSKGIKSIRNPDIASIRVRKDTIYVTLKDPAYKRLDKNKKNYSTNSKKDPKSTHK